MTLRDLPKLPPRPRKYADVYVWTFVNFAETMPHPVSPMGWSIMATGIRHFMRPLRLSNDAGYELFEFLYGRVFWNITPVFGSKLALKWLDRNLEIIGPSIRPVLAEIFRRGRVRPRPIYTIPQKLVLGLQAAFLGGRLAGHIALALLRPDRVDRGLERLEADLRRGFSPSSGDARASILDLDRQLSRAFAGLKRRFGIAGLLVMTVTASFVAFAGILMKSSGLAETVDFLTPSRPSKTATADLALWKAAQAGKEPFLAAVAQYGHRCPGEQDAFTPRPWDDPEKAWERMRASAESNPFDRLDAVTRARADAVEARMRSLGFFRRMMARPLQRAASRFLPYREDGKHYVMLILGLARRRLVDIGTKLHGEGLIAHPEDVFFLTWPELKAFDIRRDLIARRRDEFEKYRDVCPPLVVTSEGIPEIPRPAGLKGDGVSPGIARGRARVVLDPAREGDLEAGEILVAPHTDPGWTPLFLKAAAVVTEVGGMLSHGAVVAREFGLPAVVNVSRATSLLKSGDEIEVDGTTGSVRRLDR